MKIHGREFSLSGLVSCEVIRKKLICGISIMVVRDLPPPKVPQAGHYGGPAQMAFRPFGGQGLDNFMFYTYVLLCLDKDADKNILYVGSTEDLKNRLLEHKQGEVKTTKNFSEITLVYYEACLSKTDARKRELQLKTGFGRGYLKKRLENSIKEINLRN